MPGHSVPHEAAEGFVGAGVGEGCGSDLCTAGRNGDLTQTQLIDEVRPDQLRGSGLGLRSAGLELQSRQIGIGIKLEHYPVDAGQHIVCVGYRQRAALPGADRDALEVVVVDPRETGGDGDLPGATDGHSKV